MIISNDMLRNASSTVGRSRESTPRGRKEEEQATFAGELQGDSPPARWRACLRGGGGERERPKRATGRALPMEVREKQRGREEAAAAAARWRGDEATVDAMGSILSI